MRLKAPPGDLIAPLLYMTAGGVLTWVVAVFLVMPETCRQRWLPSETRYSLLGGCMVKQGNRFVPDHYVKETERLIEEQQRLQ